MKRKLLRTHIPFLPKIRLSGEEVFQELADEINKMAKYYKKHPHDFSASFELVPDPRGKKYGHFTIARVTYEKGNLKEPSK